MKQLNVLELAALRIAIDDQPSEDLPAIATEALLEGFDSPTLRQATSCTQDVREARDLFVVALDEMGIPIPTVDGATWALVHDVAAKIVGGAIKPIDGAMWIWEKAHLRVEREGDLRIFVGLASEWEDHPKFRGQIEGQIRDAANDLLSREEPRIWITLRAQSEGPPVYWHPKGEYAPFDVSELPVQDSLREEINRWNEDFQSNTKPENAGPSGFSSVLEAEQFAERGNDLARRLGDELGPTWHVVYMPNATRL